MIVVALCGLVTSAPLAKAFDRARIVDVTGRIYEGTVEELPDRYKIGRGHGITTILQKSEVREIVSLEDGPLEAAANVVRGPGREEPDRGPLTMNEESVAEMLGIAGAETILETDHFVLIHTSNRTLARKQASRLEAIYRWMEKFMRRVDVPFERPDHKLEIYFFGDHWSDCRNVS